jgi:hypothetical protein
MHVSSSYNLDVVAAVVDVGSTITDDEAMEDNAGDVTMGVALMPKVGVQVYGHRLLRSGDGMKACFMGPIYLKRAISQRAVPGLTEADPDSEADRVGQNEHAFPCGYGCINALLELSGSISSHRSKV